MRLATEAAGIATWEIDLDTGIGIWSKELYRMLGYAAEVDQATWSAWQARIHPDDRTRVAAALRHARATGGEFHAQHRIVRANDAAERHVAPFGRIYADERGAARRFVGVLTDVTEREKSAAEREQLLEQANLARAEAERANRLKDEFLASLSHELRTPMHAMLGWMQLIRSGGLSEAERGQAFAIIERNARLQNQLINELLDISRATSGKLEMQLGEVDLKEVLDAALESVRPTAEAKRIQLTQALDPNLRTIRADAGRLQQVLGNLLSNSVKFTPVGGVVHVACKRGDDLAEIVVSDNGEGIAAEVLPHVFEAFRQADGSITRRHGGLGLGLAIVQRLVALHGGTVRAHSEGLGRGARFTVTLPLHGPGAAPAADSPAAPAPPAAGSARLQGIAVLAVDDNADMLGLVQEMLRWEGASVRTATTAAAALRLAREACPDLLILDIGMPDMHGYELLQALRRELGAEHDRLPAIAVTGYASVEDAARAMAAGFQAHLAKPFDMEELFKLVETLVPPRSR
jgi:PAS domain S-box-containing protein